MLVNVHTNITIDYNKCKSYATLKKLASHCAHALIKQCDTRISCWWSYFSNWHSV